MNAKLTQPVFKWLRLSGINVSRRYLDNQLQSHPDYPSLVSITDTLDELDIENMSLVVDKERLDELPVPFLAHNSLQDGSFIVVNDLKKQIKGDKEFEKNWDGIVVLAAKPANWHHRENEKALAKDKAIWNQTLLGMAAVVLSAAFSLFNHFSFQPVGLLLATLAGVGVAVLIVQQELGISNEITEQLCSAGKETDCNVVINSKGSKLTQWFNWADAGVIYFASFLVLLIASPANPVLSLLSAAAIPFIFFSVYYQWRVVKKWCTLCLITVAVLLLQFVLLLPSLVRFESNTFNVGSMFFAAFIFVATAASWLLVVKPYLQKNKELTDKNYSLLRFKNNPDIFNALLHQQRQVDIAPFANDLQLGNPDAPIQIMVASNPYCGPCAKAHKILHELVEKNDIGVTVRFNINADQPENNKTQVVQHILQYLAETGHTVYNSRQLLHEWFLWRDYEKFSKAHPVSLQVDVGYTMKNQNTWVDKTKIQFTPTIFINGNELPKQYRLDDLNGMLSKTVGKIEETNYVVT